MMKLNRINLMNQTVVMMTMQMTSKMMRIRIQWMGWCSRIR